MAYVPAEEFAAAPANDVEEFDVRQVISILLRNKMLIIGVMVIGVLLSIFLVQSMTPLYVAEASLVLQRSRMNVTGNRADAVVQGLQPDFFTNETEAEIVQSRSLARKVAAQLDLKNNVAFNPALSPSKPGLIGSIRAFLGLADLPELVPDGWRRFLGLEPDRQAEIEAAPAVSPARREQLADEAIVDRFLSGLYVDAGSRSLVLLVEYTSSDAEFAALAANSVADLYILDQLNAKYEATERANRWLSDRVSELRLRVEESSRALEDFRREVGFVTVGDTTLYDQQLAELNTQLIIARTQLAEAEARYGQVQRLLKAAGGIESAAAVLDSPLIQKLREKEAEMLRQIAELETQYREAHPKMILARNEHDDLVRKINQEVNKIALNLGNELEVTQVREQKLQDEVDKLQNRVGEQKRTEAELREMESVVDADRGLYETVLARFKEVDSQQQQVIEPDARVISYATVPLAPSYPRKTLIIGAGILFSAIIGVLLAFLRERLESGFRSLEQVEAATGVRAICMLPRLVGARRAGNEPYEQVLDRPNSPYAEAVRTVRTALLLSDVDRPTRTVAITSTVPGEGKTTLALSLARAAAKAGQKVLIIDCDLRMPSLHQALRVPNNLGLVDFLAREKTFEEIIEIDFKSEAHYILAGASPLNATDVLALDRMHDLVRALGETYDLVVLDTPPLLAVSDTLVLARRLDKTVFVVRWNKTRRTVAAGALKRLSESGADVAGIVLSQVDIRKFSRYDAHGSGYYTRGYGQYYTE